MLQQTTEQDRNASVPTRPRPKEAQSSFPILEIVEPDEIVGPDPLPVRYHRLLLGIKWLNHAQMICCGPSCSSGPMPEPQKPTGFVTGDRLVDLTEKRFPLRQALSLWGGWQELESMLLLVPDMYNDSIDIAPLLNMEPGYVRLGFIPFFRAIDAGDVTAADLMGL